jgi:2,3-bisphosphoglycerate-independent phosphoglycerate mutase
VVAVLVVLDGASDDCGSLETAYTPGLDRLASLGETSMVRVLPEGVPVGSETAIAALLGWTPPGPVDRAAVEAAARGLELAPGERAWRVDLEGRHKLLFLGAPPLPRIEATGAVRVWPDGAVPPRILNSSTVVIGAAGAAIGLGRLMGAATVTPRGATGRPGSDLAAKRRAALLAIASGKGRILVHVGGPDEASHERDQEAKIASIQDADRELVGPLIDAVAERGGELTVCPDHGCDPITGRHLGGPVPVIRWHASATVAARR